MSQIRGEYWIQDGYVQFADGDIGDFNHELIAIHHFASKYIDQLIDLAYELGVDLEEFRRDEEHPAGDAETIRNNIVSAVENKEIEWVLPDGADAGDSVDEYIKNTINIDDDEYDCIFGGCDARLMVMEKEGWIAVRSNNVEFWGYDEQKRKEIVDGVEQILEQEGIDDPDEEIELSLGDNKTKRSWDSTLADLKNPIGVRAPSLPTTTYNKPVFIAPDNTENHPRNNHSKTMDAKTRSMASTSEGVNFKDWLLNEDKFELEKERGLRGWFDRNQGKGWIDCRASRKGKLVPCGRKKAGRGAERRYPACRPTLGACNKKGVRRKKGKKNVSWE